MSPSVASHGAMWIMLIHVTRSTVPSATPPVSPPVSSVRGSASRSGRAPPLAPPRSPAPHAVPPRPSPAPRTRSTAGRMPLPTDARASMDARAAGSGSEGRHSIVTPAGPYACRKDDAKCAVWTPHPAATSSTLTTPRSPPPADAASEEAYSEREGKTRSARRSQIGPLLRSAEGDSRMRDDAIWEDEGGTDGRAEARVPTRRDWGRVGKNDDLARWGDTNKETAME
eukprot:CAMPEP_0194272394 /NCGR_PEP_ID=MMETSP0169-20130528/5978_1 /TAXON_ID=218684 /ORGANISM="Corethron pennatum, Strain L29A3" /LENGTH=226 /DNA_ID=CAMNT_0039015045 /DNA_START=247 /DNA_END=927 /DNA_ORIENTATION=+